MIYIFGSTGMLGTYVKKILSDTFDITHITRKEYDILNDEWSKLNKLSSTHSSCVRYILWFPLCSRSSTWMEPHPLIKHRFLRVIRGCKLQSF